MTFQNDDGEILDFDGKFAITRRAVSFLNSKIQGDFSVNFDVDNNSVNRKVLGYDGPQMVNQVAFTRQSFTLIRNGNPFMKGFIVIQSDNGATLSCFFMSGNSNWLNMVQGLITELDFTGVTNGVNYEIQFSAGAYYNTTSGTVFPLVDWGYGFNKGDDYYTASGPQHLDISNDVFLASTSDYYPCFYLHTLIGEIVKQNGLKIAGSILEDPIYNKLVITPTTAELKRPDIKITSAYGANFSTSSASFVKYNQLTAGSNPYGLFSTANDEYTVDRNCKLVVTVTIVNSVVPGGTNLQIRLSNGSTVYSTTSAVSNLSIVVTATFTKGTVIYLEVRNSGGAGTVQCTLNVKFDTPTLLTASDYITPDLFLPKLSSLDIMKFVVNYFGCAASYNEHSKTITVNIIEKLKAEDAQDWSEYYVSHTSQYAIDAGTNNYQRLAPPNDTNLDAYNKKHEQKYGEGNIETGNTLKDVNDLMSIPFAASDFRLGKNQIWLSGVPLYKLNDATEPVLFQSITNSGGLNGYNFTSDYQFRAQQLVRIVDDLQGDIGIYFCNVDSAAGVVTFSIPYSGVTSTGKLYPQKITFNYISPRILINKPETLASDFGSDLVDLSGDSVSFAHFVKPTTGLNIDRYRIGATFDNPDGDFYDPTINQLYFPKIKRMIGNPVIPTVFKLPESVFQSFDFQSFIYLKTKDLTGYFWVDSIINYQDGATDVEVKLLML